MGCTIFTRVANFCRKVLNQTQDKAILANHKQNIVNIIPRDHHIISRKNISHNALKVLSRLHKAGFASYLVGGGVRDLLLGKQPKDFDVATNATPEQIKQLFRNCRLIGRRFRLAHIMFGSEIIEVATFRKHHTANDNTIEYKTTHSGMLLRDNIYGTIEEDAQRRDFTINSLYYNATDFTLRDYTNGLSDLKNGVIRLIGDPATRYREDPVRMLRAVRFTAKLGMKLEPKTAEPISQLAPLLQSIPSARLFEESLKLLQTGKGHSTYLKLREYHLIEYLFPILARYFTEDSSSNMEKMITLTLYSTDQRVLEGLRVNPAFLLAALLWYPLIEKTTQLSQEGGLPFQESFAIAMNEILDEQCKTLAIPKKLTAIMRDIWQLQLRFAHRQGKKAYKLLEHSKFRAAYDLLSLRAQIEVNINSLSSLILWWNNFLHSTPSQRKILLSQINEEDLNRSKRSRYRRFYKKREN